MCERTQEEILARELTIEFGSGLGKGGEVLKEFVEERWKTRLPLAERLLNTLDEHNREQ